MPSPVRPQDILATVASLTASLCDKLKQFLSLPSLLYSWWQHVYNSDGTFTEAFKSELRAATMPSGMIVFWPQQSMPSGWLLCNGQEVDRTTYADLFSVIGTAWGASSDPTKFKVPDLRGRVPVGADGVTFAFGTAVGAESVALTGAQVGPHTHTIKFASALANAVYTHWSYDSASPDGTLAEPIGIGPGSLADSMIAAENTGGASHPNIQPSLPAHFIIRT